MRREPGRDTARRKKPMSPEKPCIHARNENVKVRDSLKIHVNFGFPLSSTIRDHVTLLWRYAWGRQRRL